MWLYMPVVLLRLVWRARGNGAYLDSVPHRFGFVPPLPGRLRPLWIHAVSVGEAQAAAPIVQALATAHPELPIVVTTTTPTGRDRVALALGTQVIHRYMPYDLPAAVARFLSRIRPRMLVVMETELWPNLLAACEQRDVPVLIANMRLSARSARGYHRFAALTHEMLNRIDAIAAQSQEDATRILALGAPVECVRVTGSVKFDLRIPASVREQGQALRRCFGTQRSVWIAASTHEGEETQVLEAFTRVLRQVPDCLLVLVPRHPERFQAVAALARRQGYAVALRTRGSAGLESADVFIGDTMGELPLFFAASDVAFVGGSLVPVGGHNVLEPAALGLPVLVGRHVFNFAGITRALLETGACWQVDAAAELGERVAQLLADGNLRHNMGDAGRAVVEKNRGALQRVTAFIDEQLERTHDGA
jgi:3-deoxy-D-manno-octulosonic-acid transferase